MRPRRPKNGHDAQDRLQRAEAVFDPHPFDGEAARAYGRIQAAEIGRGRKARGSRAFKVVGVARIKREVWAGIPPLATGLRSPQVPPYFGRAQGGKNVTATHLPAMSFRIP